MCDAESRSKPVLGRPGIVTPENGSKPGEGKTGPNQSSPWTSGRSNVQGPVPV